MTRTKEQILADSLERYGLRASMSLTKPAVFEAMEEYALERSPKGPECEKLLKELGLEYELDSINRILKIDHEQVGEVIINIGSVLYAGQTMWTRLIDILYEAKLDKYSWLYGYTSCTECFGDEDKSACQSCGGIGRVKC